MNENTNKLEPISETENNKNDVFDYSIPSTFRIIFPILIFLSSTLIAVFSFSNYIKRYDLKNPDDLFNYYIYTFLFYTSFLLTIWSLIDFLLVYCLKNFKKKCNIGFFPFAIVQNSWLIKFASTMIIFGSTVGLILTIKERKIENSLKIENEKNLVNIPDKRDVGEVLKEETEKEKIHDNRVLFDETIFEVKEKELVFHTLMLGCLLFVFLIQRLIYQFMNYKIHYCYLKDRISKNNRHVKYLLKIAKRVKHSSKNTNISDLAQKIFDCLLKKNETELLYSDFVEFFGEDEGQQLFVLFDNNLDNSVNKNEFTKTYVAIFNEKKVLKASLEENDKTIDKLKIILFIIFGPLAAFIALSFLGRKKTFESIFGGLIGVLLPLSFIFGTALADIFQSILFIFTVRPFDIGDLITIDGKDYKVHEIGLLYTTLLCDSKFIHFPNEILRKRPIINLRRSKFVTEIIEQHFHYDFDLEIIETLKKEIGVFLSINSKSFDSNFSIDNLKFDTKKTLRLNISIQLKCSYQDLRAISEGRDSFAIFLQKTLEKLNINCV